MSFGYNVEVATIHFSSVEAPLDSPGVGILAAGLLSYAAAMDVIGESGAVQTLSFDRLLAFGRRLARQTGIGSTTLVKLQEKGAQDRARLGAILGELYEELAHSPAPDVEWKPLRRLLGELLLARLLGISASSVDRYESGARRTPDDVAARLHHVALIVSDLAGAYNEFGIRRWFDRPRTLLGGKSPKQLLGASWRPENEPARRVRALAASLSAPVAT